MSHPSFHTAIIRQTATSLRAPALCPRRACRRAGACQGTIDARYEPPCVTRLTGDDRAFFRGQIGLSVLAANIFQGKRPPVPLENNEERCIYGLASQVAAMVLLRDPATRAAARQWLRRLSQPQDWTLPLKINGIMAHFGTRLAEEWEGNGREADGAGGKEERRG